MQPSTTRKFDLQTQALLIVKQVINEIHPYHFYCPYYSIELLNYGWVLKGNGMYCRAIYALMLSLEGLRAREWKDPSDSETAVVIGGLGLLYFSLKTQKTQNLPLDSPNRLQFPSIMEVFHSLSSFHSEMLVQRGDFFDRRFFVEQTMECIKELPLLNPEETEVFKQWLSSYNSVIEVHFPVCTPLQVVCREYPQDNNMIELLIKVGACPFLMNENGQSPLYNISLARPFNGTAVKLLLNAGAHLDQANA